MFANFFCGSRRTNKKYRDIFSSFSRPTKIKRWTKQDKIERWHGKNLPDSTQMLLQFPLVVSHALQSCRLSCGHQTYCCGWQAMSKKPTAKTAFLFLTPTKIHGAFIGNETQKSAVVTVKYAVMRIKKCSIISERCGNIDCANRKGARCRWLKLFPFNF